MQKHHETVQWALDVIASYVKDRKLPKIPETLSKELVEKKAGVFVSIHTRDGNLRGCIGTIEPTQSSLAYEIRANAVSASTRDPRFPPVSKEEIDDLEVSVDVLETPEPVKEISDLDPKQYGVIVQGIPFSTSGYKRGLLLPDLEGVEDAETQVSIARRKAGILPSEPVTLFRFRVTRYH